MLKQTSLIAILMLGLLIAGCQDSSGPVEPVDLQQMSPAVTSMIQIPAGATLESATLMIYVLDDNGETIYVHRVTDSWDEMTVTWDNFNGAFDPSVIASFMADGTGWRSADITALVQDWIDGNYENFGILLDQQDMNFPRAIYNSREAYAFHPYLELCYDDGGVTVCEQLVAMADTYIWQVTPFNNYGSLQLLYTGWLNENDLEKQTLIRFEREEITDGCTRTIGYWKNWTGLGPQPDMVTQYLPIWLGNEGGTFSVPVEDVETAVEILSMEWDSAKNGIIKLYAQLLGAKLNFAAGADDSAVADVVTAADNFLADHGFESWYDLSKADKNMVLGWMETLDLYNNGDIGPGHCDDDVYVDDED